MQREKNDLAVIKLRLYIPIKREKTETALVLTTHLSASWPSIYLNAKDTFKSWVNFSGELGTILTNPFQG